MTKEQFFGRCIGKQVKFNHPNVNHYAIGKIIGIDMLTVLITHTDEGYTPVSREFKDCQIIGRRISQMTEKDYLEFYSVSGSTAFDDCLLKTDWLFEHSYFPDKYFDELKWCIEDDKN